MVLLDLDEWRNLFVGPQVRIGTQQAFGKVTFRVSTAWARRAFRLGVPASG